MGQSQIDHYTHYGNLRQEVRYKGPESPFKVILAENFSNMREKKEKQAQEVQPIS